MKVPLDSPPVEVIQATRSLAALKRLAENCRNCPLWKNATATVFGEGAAKARIVLVGEQPGDKEDRAGRPFIGPAGGILDRALADSGIDRNEVWVTNAVKHFKWKPRGKFRLHQKPSAGEIDACKPWLLAELGRIQPQVVVLLGATAGRSYLGRPVALGKLRGKLEIPDLPQPTVLTFHPSFILRIRQESDREEIYRQFVDDLKLALACCH